jgi:hypothetical protein
MSRPRKYTAQQVIAALKATKGTVYFAARLLGCDADTIQNYCKRFPTVMAAKKEHQAELVDLARLKLWDAVERGDMWAVLFTLRTLGKDQGFSERYEVTGQGGGPIQHASIRMWEERLQAAHRRLQAEREAVRVQRALEVGRNGHGDGPADRS